MYVLDYYSFNEYGIELVAFLLYSAMDKLNGCFGVILVVDTGRLQMTGVHKSDGIAVGELMDMSIRILKEEKERREQSGS